MSSQKDKFLASAQKYIQKGQFDRALRDYEQVVTADPKDVKLRQKLAELLIRCNRKEDAIREYNTIAKFYDENGFYLKSIAVYKQIQRLDPSNIEISLCLATLNEKQGMIGNALSEYKILYDHYEKQGQTAEAIDILLKMQSVDPENVDIRLKLAETFFDAELKDKAYQEFTRAALALKNRGNMESFDRVSRKINDLFPENAESSVLYFLSEQIRNGTAGDAVPKLLEILSENPDDLSALSLLSEAYRLTGDTTNRENVLKRILDLSPDNISSKKNLILCTVEAGDLERSVALLDRYLPDLLSEGACSEVEHYYTTLQNLAPYDVRLLEGLKNLYELTGESSKLADVQVSLNILNQKEAATSSKQVHEGDDISFVEEPDAGPADSPWGDEIDLSLVDDVGIDSGEEELPADAMEFGSIELAADDVTGGEPVQDDFEIDISFELPDAGDVFAPSAEESEAGFASQDSVPPASEDTEEALHADSGSEEVFSADLPNFDEEVPDFLSTEGDASDDEPVATTLLEELPDAFDFTLEETVLPLSEMVPDHPQLTPFEHPELIPSAGEPSVADTFAPGDIFARFKDTPKQEFEQGDSETHYNLGIAYMEMGLHDEAIKEFRISVNDPDRKLDSLTLQGICFRDQENYADAEEVFTSLLSLDSLDSDRILALRYELGLLYEAAGRREDALQTFREIFGTNPGFRDTMQKIALLSGKKSSFDLSDLDDEDIELEELE